jgi:MFS superfamily sulfate permease-like transporter
MSLLPDLSRVVNRTGAVVVAVDLVDIEPQGAKVDVSFQARDEPHVEEVAAALGLAGYFVRHVSDRTFLPHLGGTIEVTPKVPLRTRDDLSLVYTPGIAQSAATVRETRTPNRGPGAFNRDMIAIRAGSVAAGHIGVFTGDASPPNTAIATSTGTHSQLSNVIAAGVILIVVFVGTAPLAHLPEATLGATLVFIATKLFKVSELRTILRFDRIEFILAISALVLVAFIGIEQGVALAMVLTLADRTRRSARPLDVILGRDPATDHWIPTDIGQPTEQVPGVLVHLFYASLWYANADYFRIGVHELIQQTPGPIHALILDADAMSDIDYTGLQALRDLAIELKEHGVNVGIARASHLVHHDLKHSTLLSQLGVDHLFNSVEEAVVSLQR